MSNRNPDHKSFVVTGEEPGLSQVRHVVSAHDTAQEAREARDECIAEDLDSGDALSPTYRAERAR